MAKNYYAVLGVGLDASDGDIRAAYRRLVKQYHPDHYGADSGPFLQIQQAYAVLSDPAARRDYDLSLRQPPRDSGRNGYRRAEPMEAGDSLWEPFTAGTFWNSSMTFDELFERLWRQSDAEEPDPFEDGPVYSVEVGIPPELAAGGGEAELVLPIERDCPSCQGYGLKGFRECRRCRGEGTISSREAVVIAYPAGTRDGDAARFALQLHDGGTVGLVVRFRVVRSKRVVV
jgi:DnaJ-class molecular chaperone